MSENEEKSTDPLLALSSELPELPEPVAFLHNIPRNALFSADQMRAYANGHATYWYEMHRSLLVAFNEIRAANARGDELLAADIEYDAAEKEWDLLGPDGLGERDTRSANCPEYERYIAASQRRAAAIAAITPGSEAKS